MNKIEKIQYNDYILDFDRINKLTSHPNDNPNASQGFTTGYCYSITRKLIKEYLEIYSQYNTTPTYKRTITQDEYNKVCEVLHYNRVLVSQADIRDNKLNQVLGSEYDDCSQY